MLLSNPAACKAMVGCNTVHAFAGGYSNPVGVMLKNSLCEKHVLQPASKVVIDLPSQAYIV